MGVPRPDLGLEHEALLAGQGVINTLSEDVPEEDLALHDKIAADATGAGLDFFAAARRGGKRVPAISLCIALASTLLHWDDQGWLMLPRLADRLQALAEDDDADEAVPLLAMVATALQPFARARAADLNVPPTADCAECAHHWSLLAEVQQLMGQPARAAECALVAARLLRRAGHDGAGVAGTYAVRLLHASPRSASLVFTPRAKFPPRPQPPLSGEMARDVVLQLLNRFFSVEGAALGGMDIGASLEQMLSDKDFVLQQELQHFAVLAADGTEQPVPVQHLELRLATATLLRMQAQGRRSGRTLLDLATELAARLVDNAGALFSWRDTHLHDWFEYVAPRHEAGASGGAVACVQSAKDVALVILAEREQDVDAWLLYEQHGPVARDYLRRAGSPLA